MNGPCHFVIFGATGDLARRKLLPAIYQLEQSGRLDPQLRLTALARRDWDTPRWRRHLRASLEDRLGGAFDAECAQRLCERFEYVSGEHADDALYQRLRSAIEQRDEGVCRNVVFYLAIPPDDFDTVVRGLEQAGLNELAAGHRLVIEKPFGMDLEDARRLNARLHEYYDEGQIYRIDHYLGKETVQNLFVFRFANTVIEPLWSRHYVDHVQIIMDESEGIGTRAGYFERTGTLRDMVQSHLLQVLALVAMEPPIFLSANELHHEKAKVLRAVRPFCSESLDRLVVRAQYDAAEGEGERLPAYRQEPGVQPDSRTESFVALKLFIDNWRWQGVPFYLRSGKRLAASQARVAIRFRDAPDSVFRDADAQRAAIPANWLIISIQPEEWIRLELQARQPGLGMTPRPLRMDATYRGEEEQPLDPYATLLLDIIAADQTLFIRFDEVELAWQIVEPVLHHWSADKGELHRYASGSWGPAESARLLEQTHHAWRNDP